MSTVSPKDLYEADFVAWTRLQASELRRLARMRPNAALDCAHLAEEIADLGKEQRNAVRSWVARILEYLLLLEHVPAEEPRRGWIDEIIDFRRDRAAPHRDAAPRSAASAATSVRASPSKTRAQAGAAR